MKGLLQSLDCGEATTASVTRITNGRARANRNAFRFFAALAVVFAVGATAAADAPPGPYFNGFETNTSNWFDTSNGGDGTNPDTPTVAATRTESPPLRANGTLG